MVTVLIIVLAAAVLVLAALFVVYWIAFHSPNGTQNDDTSVHRSDQTEPLMDTILEMIRKLNGEPYERVYITSEDGLRLAGRYYFRRDGAPLILCFHGWRGTPSRDFSGGASFYLARGFNVLLIEERGQCSSEGHTITMGVMERRDCLRWIDYALERFGPDSELMLAGISMGAATVLMASGMELPANVKGIVADCPFTTPLAILTKVCAEFRLPPAVSRPLLIGAARLFGRFDAADPEADAAAAVKRSRTPILLIHGEDDRFVPCDMGRAIAAANPEMVELHTFPGAGHGLSFLVDRPRYEALVGAFCGRVLGQSFAETGEAAAGK